MQISELKLAKDLIRKPSITPKDAGAINLLAKNLRSIGFNCKIINFKNIKNLYAKLGQSKPNFCYAGHTDVVPPGNTSDWSVNPFKQAIKNNTYAMKLNATASGIKARATVNPQSNSTRKFLKKPNILILIYMYLKRYYLTNS